MKVMSLEYSMCYAVQPGPHTVSAAADEASLALPEEWSNSNKIRNLKKCRST